MILIRGIQSVSSPSIRWPTTSNALNVSGPSFEAVHRVGRPRSSSRMTPGVRSRIVIVSGRSNSILAQGLQKAVDILQVVVDTRRDPHPVPGDPHLHTRV